MENVENKKSNSQILREVQDVVDEINSKKEEVDVLLNIIDNLLVKYHSLTEEAKNNK